MAYFDDRPGSFVFCRDFVSCEQDWEICIYQKNNKRQKRIQHTDRTSDCCSLYRSYLDGIGFYECYCVILHLIVFWMVSEAIFALITKIRKKTFAKYYAGIVAIVFTVCYLAAGWYQAHHVWEKKYEIQTDKEVRNLKVAVFSDSHTGTTFHGEGFAEHMKTIEAQNPDVVLIVGDFVDDDTTKEDRTSLRIMQEVVRRWKN